VISTREYRIQIKREEGFFLIFVVVLKKEMKK
jgi:hypothetical protein